MQAQEAVEREWLVGGELRRRERGLWSDAFRRLIKNRLAMMALILLGVLLVVLGGIMVFPGIPGPGVLMLVLGFTLLDFPGKRRLEQWLIRRPTVLSAMNRLRQRYGKPPLVVERSRTSEESSPQHACDATPMTNAQRNGSLQQRGRP